MRITIIQLLTLFTFSLSAQEMQYEKGKIFYDGKKISLQEASALSESESKEAHIIFNDAIGSRIFGRMAYASGGAVLGLTVFNTENPQPQVIIGSLVTGYGYLSSLKSRIEIKRAINEYNYAVNTKAERERKRIQRQLEEQYRKDRFYAHLSERLNQSLQDIEGVYKSIDRGERYEYDIAILKSPEREEFIGMVLSSTDPSLDIGDGLFTFTPTAQSNLFFASYQNKAGEIFENKTAQLEGAVLTMGLKSFIKMYPSENEQRKFTEINPLYDWESSGSGVLMNKDGYIVTNNHVVSGANRIRIAFQNDSIDYNAVVVSQNEQSDVAILKIEDPRFSSDIKPVNWNTSFNLGQKVFTLGYPISDKMSSNVKVVDGIVSGTNGRSGDPMYFQTTLPVWYGNSGGPCFNSKGEILGLATQILWDRGEKVDNVAYITKTENIFDLGKEFIEKGKNDGEDKNLEQLIEQLIPYSVFIKVNY